MNCKKGVSDLLRAGDAELLLIVPSLHYDEACHFVTDTLRKLPHIQKLAKLIRRLLLAVLLLFSSSQHGRARSLSGSSFGCTVPLQPLRTSYTAEKMPLSGDQHSPRHSPQHSARHLHPIRDHNTFTFATPGCLGKKSVIDWVHKVFSSPLTSSSLCTSSFIPTLVECSIQPMTLMSFLTESDVKALPEPMST